MIQRFLRVKDQVKHVLLDFNLEHLFPTPEEIKMIEKLVKALEWVDATTKAICSRDTTLAKADRIFEIMIGKMCKIDGPYAQKLLGAVLTRIEERRLKVDENLFRILS